MRTNAHPFATVSVIALAAGLGGCAQILGYDGLSPRQEDASVDSGADVSTDGDDAAADTGPSPDRPPARPTGLPQQASGTGKTLTFAVKRAYFGTQTHLGATSDTAWREWGYDLDLRCTDASDSKQSINTCARADGSTDTVLVDGDRCRDNNFASQIMTLVTTYSKDVETKTNLSLLNGSGTIALVLSDVDPGDDGYAPGALYQLAATPSGTTPPWDGTDVRNVTDDSVTGGDLTKPIVSFPKGYIVGDLWLSGDGDSFPLTFGVGGTPLVLPIESGRITIPLDAARATSPNPALIVGAIAIANIETAMRPIAEAAGLCPTGPTQPFYDGLITNLKTFPDVVMGAKDLQDTTKPCDGISVGLGFNLTPIQALTTVVPAPPPAPSQCP
jgi:hypothetical protein